MTINISLPKKMYKDARAVISDRGYGSVSELVRDALRRVLYPELTENGFTPEFEEMLLKIEKEDKIAGTWETDEDIDKYFDDLDKRIEKKKRHDKSKLFKHL